MSVFQLSLPVRVETDVKLGGTQCNIIVSRLTPWLQLQQSKKKKMVLGNEKSTVERPQSTGSKAFMWTCTVSAPEMTIVLYSINGLPLYHVSIVFAIAVSAILYLHEGVKSQAFFFCSIFIECKGPPTSCFLVLHFLKIF